MDLITFFGLFVPLVASFGFLYKEIKDWRQETRDETRSIREEIKEETKIMREEIKQQSIRSDRLYEMFYDLLKEGKK